MSSCICAQMHAQNQVSNYMSACQTWHFFTSLRQNTHTHTDKQKNLTHRNKSARVLSVHTKCGKNILTYIHKQRVFDVLLAKMYLVYLSRQAPLYQRTCSLGLMMHIHHWYCQYRLWCLMTYLLSSIVVSNMFTCQTEQGRGSQKGAGGNNIHILYTDGCVKKGWHFPIMPRGLASCELIHGAQGIHELQQVSSTMIISRVIFFICLLMHYYLHCLNHYMTQF